MERCRILPSKNLKFTKTSPYTAPSPTPTVSSSDSDSDDIFAAGVVTLVPRPRRSLRLASSSLSQPPARACPSPPLAAATAPPSPLPAAAAPGAHCGTASRGSGTVAGAAPDTTCEDCGAAPRTHCCLARDTRAARRTRHDLRPRWCLVCAAEHPGSVPAPDLRRCAAAPEPHAHTALAGGVQVGGTVACHHREDFDFDQPHLPEQVDLFYDLYTDGSCAPPTVPSLLRSRWMSQAAAARVGPGGAGFALTVRDHVQVLHSASSFVGPVVTSNIAEYVAAVLGLIYAHSVGVAHLRIFTDSRLLLNHTPLRFGGERSATSISPQFLQLHGLYIDLLERFTTAQVWHIPAHSHFYGNEVVDRLAEHARVRADPQDAGYHLCASRVPDFITVEALAVPVPGPSANDSDSDDTTSPPAQTRSVCV
eukprot:SAG11_NODE_984_length_6296_cov_3.033887_2_plen_422_part_00